MIRNHSFTATKITALLLLALEAASAFCPTKSGSSSPSMRLLAETTTTTTTVEPSGWLDVLKWDGAQPDFDVLEKAKQLTSEPGYRSFSLKDIPAEYYSKDYIFRGPIVGPINRKDLVETNTNFELQKAFPDLDRQPFGFSVDPENPFRVLFFERWKATHTGTLSLVNTPISVPATGNRSISPVFPFSMTFDKDGKVIYETLTTAVDRFEGNTMGKVAVFGLFESAGLSLDNSVGNPFLAAAQKFNRFLDQPLQTFSKAENVPSWWKSKSVGPDPNDM